MTKRLGLKRTGLALALALSVAGACGAPAMLAARPDAIAAAIADTHRSEANRKLDEGRKPADVLAFAAFGKGDVVADYGAGGGYYSELIADIVGPTGRVYALDPPVFYKKAAWDPLIEAHPNVYPLVARADALWLAPDSVDAIFAHLEYHDLYTVSEKFQHPRLDVDAVLANWYAAVKPGGEVIIADHVGPAGDPRVVAQKYHRIDPARVKADMERAGFVFEGESNVLRRSDDPHNVLVFDPSVRGKTDRFLFKFSKKS